MSNLGTLILPQLHSHGNPLVIREITRKDAEGLIQNLAERTKTARKLKHYPAAIEDAFFEVNAVGPRTYFNSYDEEDTLSDLAESSIPGLRGERAVFFESGNFDNGENAAFLIGTTVIYNANWATLGVLDLSVMDFISNSTHEEGEEEEDEEEEEEDEFFEDEDEYYEDDGRCYWCGDYH